MDDLGIHRLAETDRWVGPRPTLPDYLPAIGQLDQDPRVIYAFGHQHLGMTLSAITAELVVSLAGKGRPSIDLTPFRVERFGRPWFASSPFGAS
jgi:D-amino-acid dehydrogenase